MDRPGSLPPPSSARLRGKPFLYRIPVLGKRPIHLHVFGLPDGLSDSGDGILKGKPAVGIYPVTITAQKRAWPNGTLPSTYCSGALLPQTSDNGILQLERLW